jgi:hypothetical protein
MPYFTRTKEMDRVGFESTTSASFLKPGPTYIYLKAAAMEEECTVQIPPAPLYFFLHTSQPCTFKQGFERASR